MSKCQTTIPFTHRKIVSRIGSKCDDKENCSIKNNGQSPKKSSVKENFDSPIRESNGQHPGKRSLQADNGECSPPKQIVCSATTSNNEVLFSSAIKALHSVASTKLPGREDKINEISLILYNCLESKQSSTVYISGPPGTGKTACLNYIIQLPKFLKGYQTVYVNCTGIKSSGAVYQRVADELNIKCKGRTEKNFQSALRDYLISDHKMILLILDEIDQLETKRQSTLYSIFEWPLLTNSKIVLVGVANALDLTDRILPRLKIKTQNLPTVISFPPYTKQQIIDILSERLKEAETDVLSGGALQLLASKLAAICGDIRRALDLARRVVELTDNKDHNGRSVSLEEVMNVVNNVYGTSATLSSLSNQGTGGEAFPIQQKFLICTALLVRSHSKSKELTIGKLHDVYKKVCEKRNFCALGLSEFLSLAQLVESRGVIKIHGKTQNRLSKVTMQWDEVEVTNALKDKTFLASILMDESCI